MNLRRTILGGIVFAGVVVLVLGIAGVFGPSTPEEAPSATPSATPAASSAPAGATGDVTVTDFRMRAADGRWELTAPHGRTERSGDAFRTLLTNPSLVVADVVEGKPGRLTVRADTAEEIEKPSRRVMMSGNVLVQYTGGPSGEQTAELRTEFLDVDLDRQTGRTDRAIALTAETKDGVQKVRGVGAEADYARRRVVLLRDIQMDLVGGETLIEKDAKPEKPAPTRITCDGPATADGLNQTFVLEQRVRIEQAGSFLEADRAELRFLEKERTVESFTASGNIRFKVQDAEGACERLVHRAADGQLLLTGSPAVVTQGANRAEAASVELDPRTRRIYVPVEGRLRLTPPENGPASDGGPLAITWKRSMEFDPEAHEAVFRGDVDLADRLRRIQARTLAVRFDDANRAVRSFRAEGDVRVTGRFEGTPSDAAGAPAKPMDLAARCGVMTYDPLKDRVVLSEDVAITYGATTARGARVVMDVKEGALHVEGAGSMDGAVEGEDAAPMRVAWKGGMEFNRASGAAVFRKGVSFQQGDRRLSAGDSVTLTLDAEQRLRALDARGDTELSEKTPAPKEGDAVERSLRTADGLSVVMGKDNAPDSIRTFGFTVIREGDRVVRGRSLETKDAWERIALKGPGDMEGVVPAESGSERLRVQWQGDMQYRRSTGLAVFRKHVVVQHGAYVLQTDELRAVLAEGSGLKRIETVGRTAFSNTAEEQVGIGDKLTWDLESDVGTLTGDPVELRQGRSRILGEVIEFSRKNAAIRIRGRTRVEAVTPRPLRREGT